MRRSPLFLHLCDEDQLKPDDVALIRELRPSGFLVMRYDYDGDKGAAQTVMTLARELGHTRLLVRFQANAIPFKDPMEWARNCANRMAIYDPLRADGVTLECIPANEPNLLSEGGHEDWQRHARWMAYFAGAWRRVSSDPLHLPAPARQPATASVEYWSAMAAGRVQELVDYIDIHAYRADFTLSQWECEAVFPDSTKKMIVTEAAGEGIIWIAARVPRTVVIFIQDWRNYAHPGQLRDEENPAKGGWPQSIAKWPHLKAEWLETIQGEEKPVTVTPLPTPKPDKEDIINRCIASAERNGVDPRAILGLVWAESTFVNWERWWTQTVAAKQAIASGKRAVLTAIMAQARIAGSRDFSFGPAQESLWRMTAGRDPWDLDNVLEFRNGIFNDPDAQLDRACQYLKPHLDELGLVKEALGFWNKPDGSASPTLLARYQAGLDAADAIMLQRQPPAPPPEELPHFQRGFLTKADELGRDVVGEPLENEHMAVRGQHEIAHQLTTTGEMVWWKAWNVVHFTRAGG